MTKNWKNLQLKQTYIFWWQKLQFTGETFSPEKSTSNSDPKH
jgi:hypothetical protein